MDHIPIGTLVIAVILLLVASGFFSIAETAMMAANRHRLKHRAHRGSHGARRALALLGEIDKLLGVILLGNTLVAAAAATLTAVITKRLYGEGEVALGIGTLVITFALLVFEIAPKVVGAATRTASRRSSVISSRRCSRSRRLPCGSSICSCRIAEAAAHPHRFRNRTILTQEELRSLVLEGKYFRGSTGDARQLLDVGAVTVDDVMTPRNQIHAVDLHAKPGHLAEQLATAYHHAAAGVRR
jgi:Mg2+/Co2+ transporter CorB